MKSARNSKSERTEKMSECLETPKAVDWLEQGDRVRYAALSGGRITESVLTVAGVVWSDEANHKADAIKTDGPTIPLTGKFPDGTPYRIEGSKSVFDREKRRFFYTDPSERCRFVSALKMMAEEDGGKAEEDGGEPAVRKKIVYKPMEENERS